MYHELCSFFVKFDLTLNFGNLIEFAMNFFNYGRGNAI